MAQRKNVIQSMRASTECASALHAGSANLDLLRAVAISLVVISHMPAALGYDLPGVTTLGRSGVLMFFIHTSLVLMMSLERSQGPAVVRRFYIRRALRIYPLSVFMVFALVTLRIPGYFDAPYVTPNSLAFLSNLLLIQNVTGTGSLLAPLWSLPCEVQMYLMLPFIYAFCKRYRPSIMVAASVVIWYACRRLGAGWDLLEFLPWFAMGAAVHFHRQRVRIPSGAYYIAVGLLFGIPAALRLISHGPGSNWLDLACCALFTAALQSFPEIRSARIARACHYISKYSYGLYLAHVPIMWFTLQRITAWPMVYRLTACAALLVLVPIALYWAIEHPMIKVGERLAGRLLPHRAAKAPSFGVAITTGPA